MLRAGRCGSSSPLRHRGDGQSKNAHQGEHDPHAQRSVHAESTMRANVYCSLGGCRPSTCAVIFAEHHRARTFGQSLREREAITCGAAGGIEAVDQGWCLWLRCLPTALNEGSTHRNPSKPGLRWHGAGGLSPVVLGQRVGGVRGCITLGRFGGARAAWGVAPVAAWGGVGGVVARGPECPGVAIGISSPTCAVCGFWRGTLGACTADIGALDARARLPERLARPPELASGVGKLFSGDWKLLSGSQSRFSGDRSGLSGDRRLPSKALEVRSRGPNIPSPSPSPRSPLQNTAPHVPTPTPTAQPGREHPLPIDLPACPRRNAPSARGTAESRKDYAPTTHDTSPLKGFRPPK